MLLNMHVRKEMFLMTRRIWKGTIKEVIQQIKAEIEKEKHHNVGKRM